MIMNFSVSNKMLFFSLFSLCRYNKLGLLSDEKLKKNPPSPKAESGSLVFKKVTCHPICEHQIISIATGPTHCCFLTGTLICLKRVWFEMERAVKAQ